MNFNNLIQGLNEVDRKINNKKRGKVEINISNALNIAKVFRNKEAHVSTKWHKFDSNDYDEIEKGVKNMYKLWFNEDLQFQISFEISEKGEFKIE